MITYVEYGVCDIGVVGKDTIMESGGSFYEVLDFGFGKCRFALAAPKGHDFYGGYAAKPLLRNTRRLPGRFFESKAMDVRVIKIGDLSSLRRYWGLRMRLLILWKPVLRSGKTACR